MGNSNSKSSIDDSRKANEVLYKALLEKLHCIQNFNYIYDGQYIEYLEKIEVEFKNKLLSGKVTKRSNSYKHIK